MPYPIWPTSPVPANLRRESFWGEAVQTFDSGIEVGATPYAKPLVRYTVDMVNVPRTKQQSMAAFFNTCRGRAAAFLFADPYDYRVNGVVCVNTSNLVNSFYVRSVEGFPILPASGSLAIRRFPADAAATFTADYDNGVVTLTTSPSSGDYYVASCHYFRLCKFDSYNEASTIWEIFNGTVAFHEIALP
jgi:hypothetical protein